MTIINRVRDINFVSLYLWNSGGNSKGDNRLNDPLPPDSTAVLQIPSGKCNILAFDELGNSYGIKDLVQKCTPDTVELDLEYITYGIPNFDYGYYPLNLTNSLNGFALDTITILESHSKSVYSVDGFRIFPEQSLNIWIPKGLYTIIAIDQIGRHYTTEVIPVPSSNCLAAIHDSMIRNLMVPIGIIGNGCSALFIENCLPETIIKELFFPPAGDFDGIFIDDISLMPGERIIVKLDIGSYYLTATDEYGGKYVISLTIPSTESMKLSITPEYLDYDFSFPAD